MGEIPGILHHLEVQFIEGTEHWGPVLFGETGIFSVSNYMIFLFVSVLVTSAFWIFASRKAARVAATDSTEDLVPTGSANVAEAAVDFVRNSMVIDVMGKEGAKYFPFVATVFFLVLFTNLLGLLPGTIAGSGTMGATFTWAMIVFFVFLFVGIQKNGFVGWFKSFVPSGVPLLMVPFMWFLEFVSYLIRPITLSVRLFANIFAGHVVLAVFALFTALLFSQLNITSALGVLTFGLLVIMYAFEVFVAFIQAYVFAILTAVYIGAALHAGDH
jgi:F-type H+-transporting ATPase subunit a